MALKDVADFWKKALKRTWYNVSRLEFGQIGRDIKHWWHFRHTAWRDVLEFNADSQRFKINRTTVSMRDMEPSDLPMEGAKYRAFKTDLKAPPNDEIRTEEIDGETITYINTTPASDYLYFVNNDINEANAGLFKAGGLDPKILIVLVGLGALALIYFMFFK